MDMMDYKMEMKRQKEPKRYVLFCPEVGDRSGLGFNSFDERYRKGEGNYMPHLIRYGAMLKWYQIVDTQNDNKVVEENFQDEDDELL